MSEVFETSCHVWDLDYQTPEDDSFPCAMFIINIQATFTSAASYNGGEDDEQEDGLFFMEPETESVVVEKMVEVRVQDLMNNNSSEKVRDMLVSMDIPVQDYMVERVLACAHLMGMIERYKNRKVLRMRVEIEAVVDELPHDHDHDVADENSDKESETTAVIDKLRKVMIIESPNNCCPICLEDFLVGTEAAGLPDCSHLFHPHCIIPWLCMQKICPLCRSEFN